MRFLFATTRGAGHVGPLIPFVVLAFPADGAGARPHEPGDGAEQRALARAVGAEQRDDLAGAAP